MTGPGLNWKFVFKVLGMTLVLESFFMLCAAGVAYAYKGWDAQYLLMTSLLSLFCGSLLALSGDLKERVRTVGKRESFLTVTLAWVLFTFFGAIPFCISGAIPSFTNAFFETMSGFTTTGASILVDIEALPKGLLLWRSMTQWLGGIGMVVFSLALLPLLGGEAGQLMDAEMSGLIHEKFRPRVAKVAKRIWGIYMSFTLLLILLLYLGPMDLYDSVCHAFTTISTGGYSTKQASIAYWNSTYIEGVIIVFMILGATNFSLFYFLFKRNFKRVLNDEELRWFLGIIATITLLITIVLWRNHPEMQILESFRTSIFQVVSLITTTGFATTDFVPWGPFFWMLLLLSMVICGCAGSTSGGIKIVRLVVLIKNSLSEFGRLIHPKAIIPVRLNGNALSLNIIQRLLAFIFLYILILVFSFSILLFNGLSFEEAIGASVSCMGNVGPGLGMLGPSGSYAELSDFLKWFLSFLMLVGRLEIFTILILFTPGFWKK